MIKRLYQFLTSQRVNNYLLIIWIFFYASVTLVCVLRNLNIFIEDYLNILKSFIDQRFPPVCIWEISSLTKSITSSIILMIILYVIIWVLNLLYIFVWAILYIMFYPVILYLTFTNLIADLFSLFVLRTMSVDTFTEVHQAFDTNTKFLEDPKFAYFVSYCIEDIPNFYLYIPYYLFGIYDNLCTIIWDWTCSNCEFLAFLYSVVSTIILVFLVLIKWLNSFLVVWGEQHSVFITVIAYWVDNLLLLIYPKIYSANFMDNFSFFSYINYVSNNKHPRGTNLLVITILITLSDRWLKTTLIDKSLLILCKTYSKSKKLKVIIKTKKLKLACFFCLAFYAPGYKTSYIKIIFFIFLFLYV